MSVVSGRWSPCCSKLPTGSRATVAPRSASSVDVAAVISILNILHDFMTTSGTGFSCQIVELRPERLALSVYLGSGQAALRFGTI